MLVFFVIPLNIRPHATFYIYYTSLLLYTYILYSYKKHILQQDTPMSDYLVNISFDKWTWNAIIFSLFSLVPSLNSSFISTVCFTSEQKTQIVTLYFHWQVNTFRINLITTSERLPQFVISSSERKPHFSGNVSWYLFTSEWISHSCFKFFPRFLPYYGHKWIIFANFSALMGLYSLFHIDSSRILRKAFTIFLKVQVNAVRIYLSLQVEIICTFISIRWYS